MPPNKVFAFLSSAPVDWGAPPGGRGGGGGGGGGALRHGDESDGQPKSFNSRASCLEGLCLFCEDRTLALKGTM
jgi:hypothetical protein